MLKPMIFIDLSNLIIIKYILAVISCQISLTNIYMVVVDHHNININHCRSFKKKMFLVGSGPFGWRVMHQLPTFIPLSIR
jgi:hypothetical protein